MYKIFKKYPESMTYKLISNAAAIIWDWNGTLLNDLEVSIASMNLMLRQRNYTELTKDRYREIFTFPVRDYYTLAGFDFAKDDWETVAMEFIRNYRESVHLSALYEHALFVLDHFHHAGKRQFILSAMQQEFLEETVFARLKNGYFEQIAGLNDHYAATKTENARLLVKEINIPKSEIVMIGDTLHDFEVAQHAGIQCILVASGHQSRQRLEKSGALVINSLFELMEKRC